MGLPLLFLTNFPWAMFIQGATFIPDSRVFEYSEHLMKNGLARKHMRVPYENRMPYNGILFLEKSFLL